MCWPTLTPYSEAIGVTGQFSAVDELMTGEENLCLIGRLNHLDRAEGQARISELLEHFDLTDADTKARLDLLGRNAPAAGPGHDAHRIPQGDLPRRANHRVGGAAAATRCGIALTIFVASGVTRLSHDAVPRRGR